AARCARGIVSVGDPDPQLALERSLACELPGGAHVRFTTRVEGNLSTQRGIDPEHGRERRDALCAELGLRRLYASRQVHGSRVCTHRELAGNGGEAVATDADGHATARRGMGMMVLTADCLPVALASKRGVAMLHAGWRGLAGGVLEAGVGALGELD